MKRMLALLFPLLLGANVARAETTDAILDTLQVRAFSYFWNEANPANGMIKDRSTPGSPCSIAAVGFGLSAICIGSDHGWVTRAQAASRVRTTLQTFWTAPQGSATSGTIGYKGLFYHFLDMNTALRMPGWFPELSTIDTALLLAGILDAREYFDGADTTEVAIRALADSINRRVDWDFMRAFSPGIRMGWKPNAEGAFSGYGEWIGYNEAMIMYLLALGSPTHPLPATTVPAAAWTRWTIGYNWNTQYGQTYLTFPPLFGHQYSHCWIDFRNTRDPYMQTKGIDYFENSRRATLAQQAYSIANPGGWAGYSATLWGLTASDDPDVGYQAHGAPPAQNDNGTITPTAPISSIPFAPEIVIPTITNLYNNYKATPLWGPYGFRDAFRPQTGWYATDVLGIDQGPILLMIENYRTGRVWNRFMQSPEIQLGLARAGFEAQPVLSAGDFTAGGLALETPFPNPCREHATLVFELPRAGRVRLEVFDVAGRSVAHLLDGPSEAGRHHVDLDASLLSAGLYFCSMESDGRRIVRPLVRVR